MIAELQEEKHRLDEAIEALERLSTGGGQKRRGRPPKWKQDTSSIAPESTIQDSSRAASKAKSAG